MPRNNYPMGRTSRPLSIVLAVACSVSLTNPGRAIGRELGQPAMGDSVGVGGDSTGVSRLKEWLGHARLRERRYDTTSSSKVLSEWLASKITDSFIPPKARSSRADTIVESL